MSDQDFELDESPIPVSTNGKLISASPLFRNKEEKARAVQCSELNSGLNADWSDHVVWCNPPYSDVKPWIKKASERKAKRTVMLLKGDTSTAWFRTCWDTADEIVFLQGRVTFEGPYTEGKSTSTFPSMLVIYEWRK